MPWQEDPGSRPGAARAYPYLCGLGGARACIRICMSLCICGGGSGFESSSEAVPPPSSAQVVPQVRRRLGNFGSQPPPPWLINKLAKGFRKFWGCETRLLLRGYGVNGHAGTSLGQALGMRVPGHTIWAVRVAMAVSVVMVRLG